MRAHRWEKLSPVAPSIADRWVAATSSGTMIGMRGALGVAACLAIAGCYAPTAPAGLTCDPAAPSCPRGQSCVAGATGFTCEVGGGGGGGPFDAPVDQPPGQLADAPPTDGPIDGAPPADGPPVDGAPDAMVALDTDGDTIPDSVDNCPTKANLDQYNEDGDRFGDACDPCPPIADNAPPDQDGDGVADACDPRPTTAGDSIALFEGFSGGVPAWNKTGTWTAASGAITSDSISGHANLTVAGPTTGHLTVSAGMQVGGVTSTDDGAAGVVESYNHGAHTGLYCHLTSWGTDGTHVVINVLQSSGIVLDAGAFDFTVGEVYTLRQRRDGNTRSCDVTHGAASATETGSSSLSPTAPEVGLRLVHSKATFTWLMVVSNN